MLSFILCYNTLVAVITVLVSIVAFFKWRYSFWKRHGVPSLNPIIPFGDVKDMILMRLSSGEQYTKIYKQIRARGLKHMGVYTGFMPAYVPVDPELIKSILLKDFEHFVNHDMHIDEENDPLSGHLFALRDDRWRNMRVKLTPTFTSGKMRMMFQTFAACTEGLKGIMEEENKNHSGTDIKEVMARFTTDVIGSAAFGLECNSLKDPDVEFRRVGRNIFLPSTKRQFIQVMLSIMPPGFAKILKLMGGAKHLQQFFTRVVKETVQYREENNVYRKDFMHMLIQLKNFGKVTDDGRVKNVDGKMEGEALTYNEIIAQALVFFVAGFETSSTLTTFTLFELTQNPDVQDKLREEINLVLAQHNNELTYDSVNDMKYLEQVLNEALRKHSPATTVRRFCTKDYNIPGTNGKILKGTRVIVPVMALHHDPEYYPDPQKFDPDRFCEKNKNSRPTCVYMPFGQGPRICIGMRFGLMQSKVALITLLKDYKVSLNSKTKMPMKYDTKTLVLSIDGGLWINVEKVN